MQGVEVTIGPSQIVATAVVLAVTALDVVGRKPSACSRSLSEIILLSDRERLEGVQLSMSSAVLSLEVLSSTPHETT